MSSNQFLRSTVNAIQRHGVLISYKSILNSQYNVDTSTVTETTQSFQIKSYPKQLKFTAYNFPDLVGKEGILFYIANDITFTPKLSDLIIYNSGTYVIKNIQSHMAEGSIVLYRIVAIKG